MLYMLLLVICSELMGINHQPIASSAFMIVAAMQSVVVGVGLLLKLFLNWQSRKLVKSQ